jgi:hypothetical protein
MKSRRGRPHGASQMDSAARASFALLPEVVSALQCRFRLARRGLGDVLGAAGFQGAADDAEVYWVGAGAGGSVFPGFGMLKLGALRRFNSRELPAGASYP